MKKRHIITVAIVATMAACSLANAQVTAAISGKVEDPTGSGVSGTTVTVRSVETGADRTTTTDQDGNYSVLSLPLGAQEVKAEKQGFKSALRTGVNLEVGEEAVVNLRLEVGDLRQQVTVAA